MKVKIMIVEDEPLIAQDLSEELRSWGYEVFCLKRFDQVDEACREIAPELLLLDVILPFQNGFYWCQKIREFSAIPILFLTSRSAEVDLVRAMEAGGDDYLTKPYSKAVLVAKIQALLRRSYALSIQSPLLHFSDYALRASACELSCDGRDEILHLTKVENQILQALFRAQGEVVRRSQLLEDCWQSDEFIDDNTLAVNVSRLRKKLREAFAAEELIETVKGMGYKLNAE